MKRWLSSACMLAAGAASWWACSPPEAKPVRPVKVSVGEIDPAEWGKAWPLHYVSWALTREPSPAGSSRYKRGFDARKTYDKLSEYPYLALLFDGWGFGVEYNEPRGHSWMLEEQVQVVDKSRMKAGGVCLSCKTPYASRLRKELGGDYYRKPFEEVHGRIPEKHRLLGAACSDCHEHTAAGLRIDRDFTLGAALRSIGKDPSKLHPVELRSLVCAQCHVTYCIPKDKEKKSVGLFFPWQGAKDGRIAVETVIAHARKNHEWTQSVTGFPLGFIRHPEYELFSNDSPHWKAGAACADCHMPYQRAGSYKISDHRIMSPLKNGLRGCVQCHPETPEWLRERVYATQDRTVSLLNRAGYATAVAAKLFELANRERSRDKTRTGVPDAASVGGASRIDQALYAGAKGFYEEAFYRLVFVGAENSVGFHNPAEALRVLGDAVAYAGKAEALLRQALAQAGVKVPAKVDLELPKHLDGRGERKLMFDPAVEIKDPFGTQAAF
ncbi:MAG: ammonia-forming cytochrome c nitrite reductase subunit c552 [Elusimicrobia bacterium]|nr:ammonia-forming cytochrome c nitrite reductase subunit c552 [Elusimicrobiota bacterium]